MTTTGGFSEIDRVRSTGKVFVMSTGTPPHPDADAAKALDDDTPDMAA
jgi:hypothetical protein